MKKSQELNGIEFELTVTNLEGTEGFIKGRCDDKELAEITGAMIVQDESHCYSYKVEFIEPWTYVTPNGQQIPLGDYYSVTVFWKCE